MIVFSAATAQAFLEMRRELPVPDARDIPRHGRVIRSARDAEVLAGDDDVGEEVDFQEMARLGRSLRPR